MKIKVINRSKNLLPAYETALSAGADVRADIAEDIVIAPLQRVMVPTGLFFEIEPGYEVQVRPRSGLAAKFGVTVLNTPGTIDADYRGEVKVILINLSDTPYTLTPAERIAQLVAAPCTQISWEEVSEIGESERGAGGFGSTGKK